MQQVKLSIFDLEITIEKVEYKSVFLVHNLQSFWYSDILILVPYNIPILEREPISSKFKRLMQRTHNIFNSLQNYFANLQN